MSLGEYVGSGSGVTKLLLHLNGTSVDSSGNANNGISNNVGYGKNYGVFNQGGLFTPGPGNNTYGSYIEIAHSTSLNFTNKFTCSIWFNKTNGWDHLFLLGKGSDWNTGYSLLLLSSGADANLLYFSTLGTTNQTLKSKTQFTTNVWYNVVCVYNGTNKYIYINGKLDNSISSTGNITTNTVSLKIGRRPLIPQTFPFWGSMDEVIIENRVWSEQEIKKYYTQCKGRFATL
ncbi:MAG: LamG domain-containing protein [Paludibacter sp.]